MTKNSGNATAPHLHIHLMNTPSPLGSTSLPGGFLIGFYGGSGVGLSSSADGVNLFDAVGNVITGVSFGASSPFNPRARSWK